VWEKEVLPPSSPDCNPLNNFVCGVSDLKVNAKPHNRIEDLFQKMKVLVGFLDRDTMAKACKRFRSRIEAFITANNHFLE
jgi:hypothetical protein